MHRQTHLGTERDVAHAASGTLGFRAGLWLSCFPGRAGDDMELWGMHRAARQQPGHSQGNYVRAHVLVCRTKETLWNSRAVALGQKLKMWNHRQTAAMKSCLRGHNGCHSCCHYSMMVRESSPPGRSCSAAPQLWLTVFLEVSMRIQPFDLQL